MIVAATVVVVIGGGVLMRFIDHSEYSSVWVGMWWSLQTVTTVGYGDVTPSAASGRIVAAFVMLEGISFLAVLTAAITSTFVARATRTHDSELEGGPEDETSERKQLDARFDRLERKLDGLEATLREAGDT